LDSFREDVAHCLAVQQPGDKAQALIHDRTLGDEASAETLLKAELLLPQHKPAHVMIRQQW
jgi:hypothetical protein